MSKSESRPSVQSSDLEGRRIARSCVTFYPPFTCGKGGSFSEQFAVNGIQAHFGIYPAITREQPGNVRRDFYRSLEQPLKSARSKRYGIVMHRTERADGHERFKELCALAQANSLGMVDQLELMEHLTICDSCRKIHDQYAAIGSEGMAFLLGSCAASEKAGRWDHREARRKLLASIQAKKPHDV